MAKIFLTLSEDIDFFSELSSGGGDEIRFNECGKSSTDIVYTIKSGRFNK